MTTLAKGALARAARAHQEAWEELEADLVAIDADARHAGVLVVMPFPENVDTNSHFMCCSRLGGCKQCRRGVFEGKVKKP